MRKYCHRKTQKTQKAQHVLLLSSLFFPWKIIMKILVTVAASFIGYALSSRLLERGGAVIGNHHNYCYPALKEVKRGRCVDHSNYTHIHPKLL